MINNFWSRVKTGPIADCWPFITKRTDGLHAQLKWKGRLYGAHRVAYFLSKGDPKGYQVQHLCNNPLCCNPEHLTLGGPKENAQHALRTNTPWGKGPGASGLKGVHWNNAKKVYEARGDRNKGGAYLYAGRDFFEACCSRKSWEAKQALS